MSVYAPQIRVEVGRHPMPTPVTWTLDQDILTAADYFSASWPATSELIDQLALDSTVRVWLGRARLFTGRIDDRPLSDGSLVTITGRDNIGRLVDESVPGAGFGLSGLHLSAALQRLVEPWFSGIRFSNAADRRIRVSARRRARTAGEPAITASDIRSIGIRVEAGAKRWEGIQQILGPLRLLAWSSADGRNLIVARPNYAQTTQYRLFRRFDRSNVLRISWSRSVSGRYSSVELSGTQTTSGIRPPPVFSVRPGYPPPKRINFGSRGVARDTSGDFQAEKRLFVVDSSVYPRDARARAERLLGEMNRSADEIEVTVAGFGLETALFAPDTLATVNLQECRALGLEAPADVIRASYYITAVSMSDGDSGPITTLRMVPRGTQLI